MVMIPSLNLMVFTFTRSQRPIWRVDENTIINHTEKAVTDREEGMRTDE